MIRSMPQGLTSYLYQLASGKMDFIIHSFPKSQFRRTFLQYRVFTCSVLAVYLQTGYSVYTELTPFSHSWSLKPRWEMERGRHLASIFSFFLFLGSPSAGECSSHWLGIKVWSNQVLPWSQPLLNTHKLYLFPPLKYLWIGTVFTRFKNIKSKKDIHWKPSCLQFTQFPPHPETYTCVNKYEFLIL